jgi:two-component system phosphate regulon sensor histidine kinase PhoR
MISLRKESQRLLEILQSIQNGKQSFPIILPDKDDHQELTTLLNSIFEKKQKEVDTLKMRVSELEKQNNQLAEHAQVLTQQKQDIQKQLEAITGQIETTKKALDTLTHLTANIHQGIIALDEHSNILFFNKAAEKITGYGGQLVIKHPISELITVFDKTELITSSVYSNSFYRTNLKVVGNGKTAFVNLRSTSAQIDKHPVTILTIEDVTEDQQVERLKLDFVSMAAHELRTPLTTIRGYVSFLQDDKVTAKLDANEVDYLKKISISSIRLNELVENLLTISKIEQGKMIIDPQPVDIIQLLTKITQEYTIYAEYRKLGLEFKNNEINSLLVKMDTTRIEEVLINLMSNAINYTPSGKITVQVQRSKQEAVVSVTDTGVGIPKEAQSQLFTKYFRVQGNTSSAKGTGLGLYISKTIIEAHHGKIWVESTPGHGTTFSFSLPLA